MKRIENFRVLERLVRGFGNHRRIRILELVEREPELSVVDIADKLKINFKTAADHIRRLTIAGMLMKRAEGPSIRHKISPRGVKVLKFLRTLE